jgi:hypothetical protein
MTQKSCFSPACESSLSLALMRCQRGNRSRCMKIYLWIAAVVLLLADGVRAGEGGLASHEKSVVVADFESATEAARWTGRKVEQTSAQASSGQFGLRFDIPQ